jgi:hypothetical protein
MRLFTHFEAALGVCKVDFCGSGRKNPGFKGKARQTPSSLSGLALFVEKMRCFTHFEAALGDCGVDFSGSGRKNPGFKGIA